MPNINSDNRWVKITRTTESGFVEFEFYVGDVDLCVELILPVPAFKEFCETNRVKYVDEQGAAPLNQAPSNGLLKVVK